MAAGTLSTYAEKAMLNHILMTGGTWSMETNLYVGLSTGTLNSDTSGTTCDEVTGTGYARVTIDNAWTTTGDRVIDNDAVITFAEADDVWGTVTDWFVANSLTVGDILAYGSFDDSKAINTGDDASIAAGALTITVTGGGMSDYLATKILNHIFKVSEYTQPTELWVGLSTATIQDGSDGSSVVEPSDTYLRVQQDTWDDAVAGLTENTHTITFPTSEALWGEITDFFIADASLTSEILFYEAVDNHKVVGTGDTAQIEAGSYDVTLD